MNISFASCSSESRKDDNKKPGLHLCPLQSKFQTVQQMTLFSQSLGKQRVNIGICPASFFLPLGQPANRPAQQQLPSPSGAVLILKHTPTSP